MIDLIPKGRYTMPIPDHTHSPDSGLVRSFHRALIHLCERAQRDYGHRPTRLLQMIDRHGAVKAAERLVADARSSDYLTRMWEHRALENTVEALILNPDWGQLFSPETRASALRKLEQLGWSPDGVDRMEAV
ncbi:hypothetical protein [Methylocaldum sp.]|jgi:hypothetical protein|uniref:hypothetical protein n=1 Tax=Methylocaldum sp. TaxID=1969727 RepID=UPI0032203679